MSVVIAIDAGTTGVRSFALRPDGSHAGYAYREFPQHFPRPGLVEHDPGDIWDATVATLADLGAWLADAGEPVSAIGITNQRETAVVWDRRTGRPRHRALVWQDRRTAGRCDALAEAGYLDEVRRRRLRAGVFLGGRLNQDLEGESAADVRPQLAAAGVVPCDGVEDLIRSLVPDMAAA